MSRQLFRYLLYLLLLFQIPCFVASVSTISATGNVAQEEPQDDNRKKQREDQIKAFFEEIKNCKSNEDFEKLKNKYIELYKSENSKKNDANTPFTYAARNGKLKALKKLKEWGEDLNAKDAHGNNALHLACLHSESVRVVEWLLDVCKIGVETKGQDGKTPFLYAARRKTTKVAKLLKERDANIKATDNKNRNALHFACYFLGKVPMVKWLLDECEIGIESKGEDQKTPFLSAAEGGNFDVAKLLKDRGANIHAKDEHEDNALHLTCLGLGNQKMVTWLLDVCKIEIESKGEDQRTPFLSAAEGGNFDVAKLLKGRDANIHAKNKHGDNALHYACLESSNEEMVTWLLDVCKIGIESKGKDKRTPFLCAVEGGDLDIAKLLKDRGANIHAKDGHEDNALHYACLSSDNEKMVTWLCEIGDKEKGLPQIANLLRERSNNGIPTDWSGNNALHIACLKSGSIELVTWLLDVCKIGIESKGKDKRTPFLCAVEGGDLEIVKLLAKKGANIYAKDSNGNTALQLANDSQVRNHLYLILVESLAPWFFLVLVISTLLFWALSNAKDKRMLKNRRISRNKKSSKNKRSSRASHRRQRSR